MIRVPGLRARQNGDGVRLLFSVLLAAATLAHGQQPQQQPEPGAPALPDPRIQVPQQQELPPETSSDYQGPVILSRGGRASVSRGDELFRLHPFASVEGVYDSALVPVSITSDKEIPYTDAYGVEANFGVTGTRAWKRSELDLDYRGLLRHYTEKTFYDGTDHILMLRYINRVSRRWEVGLTQAAATFSRGFMMPLGAVNSYDQNFNGLIGAEMFDSRTNAAVSGGQAIFQRTLRTSFGMGINGFIVRRRSSALVGATGWTANGNWAYRLTRNSTVGAGYTFNRFHFTNRFGESAVHGIALDYARRLTRHWELSLRAGGYRIETSRLIQIQLDPVIAAILGSSTGVRAFHGITYLPQYTGRLTYGFRRSSLTAEYGRMVSTGNGVYLTSGTEYLTGSYTNQTTRRISTNLGGGMVRLRSLSQTISRYRSYQGNAGLSFKFTDQFAIQTRFEVRTRQILQGTLDRKSYRVTVGFGWAPSEYPVSLW